LSNKRLLNIKEQLKLWGQKENKKEEKSGSIK